MTPYILEVRLQRQEGALLRLLGTIERRGFAIVELHTVQLGDTWAIHIAVASHRSQAILCQQLRRLIDVLEVTDSTPQPAAG